MSEEKTYIIFDGDETEYQVVPPTNANIREVCRIITQAAHKSDEERLHYAQEGDISPDKFDNDGRPEYTLKNIYLQGTYWPALAQQLFFDCPKMLKVSKGDVKIADKEKYESLNRAEVRRAFNEFLGKFGATPFEVRSLLNVWDNGQIRGILEKIKELKQQEQPSTNTPNGPGETPS